MKINNKNFCWKINALPFVYKILDSPSNDNNIPNFLPFELMLHPKTGVLMQKPNQKLTKLLTSAYNDGSVLTGILDDQGIGKEYTEDVILMMRQSLQCNRFDNKDILEIGCGTGYLLYRLKLLGANVLGIEPGKHGQLGAKKYSVPIIKDFFPSSKITSKFDIIILYNVIEHIPDPIEFCLKIEELVKNEKSKILLVVEDEEPYIKNGDISFLFHEHFSYFTKKSLFTTLDAIGGTDIKISNSKLSHLLFATFSLNNFLKKTETKPDNKTVENTFLFKKRVEDKAIKIKNFILETTTQNKEVGIFVPGRGINVLIYLNIPLNNIRFFDDNPLLHGKYYPGIDIPIESREDLLKNSPSKILIMSSSFGKKIANSLLSSLPKNIQIKTINNI